MNTEFDALFCRQLEKVYVTHREGFYTSVTNFHKHDFFEINLIVSGNIKILLSDASEQTNECRMVLTRPDTTHFITCNPDTLYSRYYLLFSKDFLMDFVTDFKKLEGVFGQNGNIISLNSEQCDFCKKVILKIDDETDIFRKKLLVMYLLSCLSEFSGGKKANTASVPSYIIDALYYIENHYGEKITAAELSAKLYIGRTTLMTNFKRYTGYTLNNYIIAIRLKNAVLRLREGYSEQQAAELCGFSDAGGLIRCFKQNFNTTPHRYIKNQNLIEIG